MLAACGGGGSPASGPLPGPVQTAPTITVSDPSKPVLGDGGGYVFSAKLSEPGDVAWSLAPGSPGGLQNTGGASITYVASGAVKAPTRVTLIARSGATTKEHSFTLYPDPGPARIALVAGAAGSADVVDGKGSSARFARVTDMVADDKGNFWIADDNALRRLAPDGTVTTVKDLRLRSTMAGGYFPQIVALAKRPDGRIRMVTEWLGTYTFYTAGVDGVVQDFELKQGYDLHVKRLLELGGNKAYLVFKQGVYAYGLSSMPIDIGFASDQVASFSNVRDAALDANGNLYVVDDKGLHRMTPDHQVSKVEGLAIPLSVAVNSKGEVLVLQRADAGTSAYSIVRLASQDGNVNLSGSHVKLAAGIDPAVGGSANLLRAGSGGEIVLAAGSRMDIVAGASVTSLAGLENDTTVPVDGPASSARFMRPGPLGADAAGNLYLYDLVYDRSAPAPPVTMELMLRKVAPDGTVTTVSRTVAGTPAGIAVTAEGAVYTAGIPTALQSHLKPQIYRTSPQGVTQALAGSEAVVRQPRVSGLDSAGNVIVSDVNSKGVPVWHLVAADGTLRTVEQDPRPKRTAWDGLEYSVNTHGQVVRINADGSTTVITDGGDVTTPGPLPGRLALTGVNAPLGYGVIPFGPYTLAAVSGNTIVKIVLPR